jgi:hypothetical protein
MRSHSAVLRKITELNLDPAVSHVSDGYGGMVPKFDNKVKNIEYTLGERLEKMKETVTEVFVEQKEEFLAVVEDTKESIEFESNEDVSKKSEDTVPAEDSIVKKKFPFQKKKVVPTEQHS